MQKNSSFYVPHTLVDEVIGHWKGEVARVQNVIAKRVEAATNIVYATARTKRGLITVITEKKGNASTRKMGTFMTITGAKRRLKGSRRVSDPSAKFGVPVSAQGGGALRASIDKEIVHGKYKSKGRVFTDSPYAEYIEFGTWKMQARPFMRPALYENATEIQKIFKQDA